MTIVGSIENGLKIAHTKCASDGTKRLIPFATKDKVEIPVGKYTAKENGKWRKVAISNEAVRLNGLYIGKNQAIVECIRFDSTIIHITIRELTKYRFAHSALAVINEAIRGVIVSKVEAEFIEKMNKGYADYGVF